ncbi:sensor histidine kinase [Chengkuizengella axinellae]|uniref:histidine kinase n=1 Tax=Chengkuizengella axinellae TaxID=3064388 RepID=A0ABT9J5C1_9BACL|nr:ATP-binding protein [Chengkuizengella sp. 2205SS18-9]MDP5276802.1 ATP-binding protein [Chengkuizengella sp. 2205SS18-9]
MKKKILISILITLFISIQCWFVFLTFKYPYTGIQVERNDINQWIITDLDKLKIDSHNSIQVGDEVLQVNHKETKEFYSIQKWGALEQFDHLLLSRNGQTFEIQSNEFATINILKLLFLFGAFLCYLQSYLLIKKAHQLKSAVYLSFLFITIGLTLVSVNASIQADLLGKTVVLTCVMLVPVISLHFLIVLLKEKSGVMISTKTLYFLYSIVLVMSISQILNIFTPPFDYSFYHFTKNFTMFYFLFGILFNFIYVVYVFFKYRSNNSYVSSLIKTILFCLFVTAVPFSLFSFLPALLFGEEWVSSFYTAWLVFFFPSTFTYLILSKQIFDIDVVIRRTIYTLFFSIIPSMLIVYFISIIFNLKITTQYIAVSFTGTLLTIFLSLFSIKYFFSKLENTIFPHRRGYKNSLDHILKKLTSITNFHDLEDQILTDIINLFKVHGGIILLKYKEKIETIHVGKINVQEVENLLDSTPFEIISSDYSFFQINHYQEYTSYLILTKKKNNSKLGLEETEWMNLIISYMKVSLENIYFIRKYTFELQEKERFDISLDLHDSTLQDLLLLRRKISILTEKSSSKQVKQELRNIINYVDTINLGLRQNFFELNPYLIKEMGLIKAIEQLVDQEKAINLFNIHFSANNDDKINNLNLELKQHIFRIIQELINNTKKHADATNVNIQFEVNNDSLLFIYEDNGIGFKTNHKNKPSNLFGMGLEQIRYRVSDVNGQLKVHSSESNGVKFIFKFPLKI